MPHEAANQMDRMQVLANAAAEVGCQVHYEAKYWTHDTISVIPTGGSREEVQLRLAGRGTRSNHGGQTNVDIRTWGNGGDIGQHRGS